MTVMLVGLVSSASLVLISMLLTGLPSSTPASGLVLHAEPVQSASWACQAEIADSTLSIDGPTCSAEVPDPSVSCSSDREIVAGPAAGRRMIRSPVMPLAKELVVQILTFSLTLAGSTTVAWLAVVALSAKALQALTKTTTATNLKKKAKQLKRILITSPHRVFDELPLS